MTRGEMMEWAKVEINHQMLTFGQNRLMNLVEQAWPREPGKGEGGEPG